MSFTLSFFFIILFFGYTHEFTHFYRVFFFFFFLWFIYIKLFVFCLTLTHLEILNTYKTRDVKLDNN